MPFKADSRCGLMNIELNVYVIWEELETYTEKIYAALMSHHVWLWPIFGQSQHF